MDLGLCILLHAFVAFANSFDSQLDSFCYVFGGTGSVLAFMWINSMLGDFQQHATPDSMADRLIPKDCINNC